MKEDLTETKVERRRSRSLFGPIVLIGAGVVFLLCNLGVLPGLNWLAALSLWPVLLILLGINLVLRQAPAPWGTFLSILVALAAVGILLYALLFTQDSSSPGWLRWPQGSAEMIREQVAVPAADLRAAAVHIELAIADATIAALKGSDNLLEGDITHAGELILEVNNEGGEAEVRLASQGAGGPFFGLGSLASISEEDNWIIGLSPEIPLALEIDGGVGAADLDLSELQLQDLVIDGGAGRVSFALPPGDYTAVYNAGVGSTQVTLAAGGRQQIEIDGGAGSISVRLPRNQAARIEVESGLGSVHIDEANLRQISGDDADNGVWQTEGFEDAADRVELSINVGLGSVVVEPADEAN